MENNIIYMKVNLRKEKEMGKEHFGGKINQSIVDNFFKGNKQAMEYFIEKVI